MPPVSEDQAAWLIVLRRMAELREAIVARDWIQVEFQFDRVLRAVTKGKTLSTRPSPNRDTMRSE